MTPHPPPWLFVHVPKTAGTSLTVAAKQAFGEARCEFDYGVGNPNTTTRVRTLAHEAGDLFRLQHRLHRDEVAMLGGHVPLARYAPLFRASRIVSFVREPLAQLLSHHAHLSREQPGQWPFERFLMHAQGAGIQSRMLAGAPLEALGPIGLTERYDDSLRVINASLGLSLQPRQVNQNPGRHALDEALYQVPEGWAAQVEALLRPDRALYTHAGQLLDQRLAMLAAGQPFTQGALQACEPGLITGFAFRAESSTAVPLELLRGGRPVAAFKATRFSPRLRALNVSRDGHVGFEHRLQPPLAQGETVELRAADTGQVLGAFTAL